MEMQQIRYFLAVCDHGNFSRAAKQAYISQPSLTQAIKKLEDELGGQLFVRDRAGCRLTPLGKLVEPGFRKMAGEAQAIKKEAIRFLRLKKEPLRIGLAPSIGARKIGPLIAAYQQRHPHIELELIVDGEAALFVRLQTGLLEALVASSGQVPAVAPFKAVSLYRERYVAAFAKSHRFSRQPEIALRDLEAESYLDRLNCELREKLKEFCEHRAINLYAAYRSNNESWILHMVRLGLGIALLPEYTLAESDQAIDCRYLEEPALTRQIQAVYDPKAVNAESFISELILGCY